jgi:hypothetical protein
MIRRYQSDVVGRTLEKSLFCFQTPQPSPKDAPGSRFPTVAMFHVLAVSGNSWWARLDVRRKTGSDSGRASARVGRQTSARPEVVIADYAL